MLIRIRRSKDLLLQFQSFECSSLFASNSCVYCTTRSNKCGRIGTKWLFFFTFIEECCVVIEKNIDKKLANRISYQIWYKGCLKGKFGRGVQICEGGPYPLADLDRGGPGDITLSHFTQRYTICVYAIPLDTCWAISRYATLFVCMLYHSTLRWAISRNATPFVRTLCYSTLSCAIWRNATPFVYCIANEC